MPTMKKFYLLGFILFSSFISFAQNYSTSLGVRLGSGSNGDRNYAISSAISLKHFFNEKAAAKLLFGPSYYYDILTIGAIFELHHPIPKNENLTWFYGGGAYISFNDLKSHSYGNLFGAMGIIGLDYKFKNLPINLELECKPELNIVDAINFELFNFGFSMRYAFGSR